MVADDSPPSLLPHNFGYTLRELYHFREVTKHHVNMDRSRNLKF